VGVAHAVGAHSIPGHHHGVLAFHFPQELHGKNDTPADADLDVRVRVSLENTVSLESSDVHTGVSAARQYLGVPHFPSLVADPGHA